MGLRSPVVASIVVLAGFLAGCGGSGRDDETNAYVTAVRTTQTRFATSIERIERDAKGSTGSVATVDRYRGAVDRMAQDLREIDAPQRIDGLHTRLVGEVDEFRAALRRAGRAFRSRDRAAILAQRTRLIARASRATRDIDATFKRIDRELGS